MKAITVICIFLAAAAVGCSKKPADKASTTGSSQQQTDKSAAPAERVAQTRTLELKLVPKSGSMLIGKALMISSDAGVDLTIKVEQAMPGEHAVHLHEVGDCSAPDASSAGGHWNPTTEDHGKWGKAPHHLGDIGNLTVGSDGVGMLEFATDRWTVGTGAVNDIIGRALVVHEKPDDFTSQPTGAAGARIACAEIR